MNVREIMQGLFSQLREENSQIPEDKLEEILRKVEELVENEPAPRIALIGESGVGKSSTLNVLFGAGQAVSHRKAETQIETEIQVKIDTMEGTKGALIVYDMPGLGESQATQQRHLATYRRVLKNIDVVLWILDAQFRAIKSIQDQLSNDIKQINPEIVDRIVFALNKVDLVHPGEKAWHPLANIPSEEQENHIKARLYDVQLKIKEVSPTWNGTVMGYSATKRYNLPQLFASMLDAVPKKRQWMLTSRKALADFFELVDPNLIPEELRSKMHVAESKSDDPIDRAIEDMSEEEFLKISRDKSTLSRFLRKMRAKGDSDVRI
jgi:predicted GTPase